MINREYHPLSFLTFSDCTFPKNLNTEDNTALKVRPNFAYAYNNRGVLKVAMKDIQGAMDDYAKALELKNKKV